MQGDVQASKCVFSSQSEESRTNAALDSLTIIIHVGIIIVSLAGIYDGMRYISEVRLQPEGLEPRGASSGRSLRNPTGALDSLRRRKIGLP